jgi:hypothetical protein
MPGVRVESENLMSVLRFIEGSPIESMRELEGLDHLDRYIRLLFGLPIPESISA